MNKDALEQEPKTDSWSIKDVADTFKKHGLIRVQEPSGNAIDRKIISAFLSGLISDETERKKALQYVNELPPVNHQETATEFADRCRECGKMRKGHWIAKDDKEQGYDIGGVKTWYIQIMCSECGFIKTAIEGHTGHYKYCPNCGCRMVEPQESEDKE